MHDRTLTTRRSALALIAGAFTSGGAFRPTQAQTVDSAQGKARIGIIGSGHIGSTVGTLWVQAGHPVLFSSRHPETLNALVDGLGPLARAGTPQDAAAFGDVVFTAVPYGELPSIGRELAPALAGKVLIDAGNAVAARDGDAVAVVKDQGIGLATASFFPGVRVVRAFNVLNYRILQAQAHRTGDPLAIPIAGDDAGATAVASTLVRDAGFEPVLVGPLSSATQFAMGGPGYGKEVDASVLRQLLGLPPAPAQ